MTQSEFAKCVQVLEKTPEILERIIEGVEPGDLGWRPSPQRWSISMVLAHLGDVEVRGFYSRFEAILKEDNPFLPPYAPAVLFQSGQEFEARSELANFRAARARTLEMLRGLSSEAADRTGRHQDFGTIAIEELLNEFAFHDLGHTRQLMELYRAHAFFPHIGAFQSIYKVNP